MNGEYPGPPNGRDDDTNYTAEYPYCPECDVASRPESGELVCTECMAVVQDNYLDLSRTRHARTDTEGDQSKARSTTTRTRHDRGLGSAITPAYEAPHGAANPDLERAQQWWATNSQDRSLQLANNEIKRVTAALNLPKYVREEASRLFYIATVEEDLLHGRSIELVVAGSVYTAAYLNRIPQTPSEVANEVRCDTNDVHEGHKLIVGRTYVTEFRPDPVDYLPRFAQALHAETDLDYQHATNLQSMAHHLIDKTFNQKPNTSVRVLAASALYAASQTTEISITRSDVTTVTGVDEATISRHYKTFLNTGS